MGIRGEDQNLCFMRWHQKVRADDSHETGKSGDKPEISARTGDWAVYPVTRPVRRGKYAYPLL